MPVRLFRHLHVQGAYYSLEKLQLFSDSQTAVLRICGSHRWKTYIIPITFRPFFFFFLVIALSDSVTERSKLIFCSSYLCTKSIQNLGLKYQSILAGDLI